MILISDGQGDGGPGLMEYDVEVNGTLKALVFREGLVAELALEIGFVISVDGSVAMALILEVDVEVTVPVDVSGGDVTTRLSFVRDKLTEEETESVAEECRDDPVVTEVPAVATAPKIVLEVDGVLDALPEDTMIVPVEVDKDTTSPSAVREVLVVEVEVEEVPT